MTNHNDVGRLGEDLAVDFLSQKGYKILERNWRHRRTEIDIIAQHEDLLVFVEVKTRTADYFGEPATQIQDEQMQRLSRGASVYMHLSGFDWEVRFDIIGVLIRSPQRFEIKHFEDVWFDGW